LADIFISYRREDSGGHAGRLGDRLSARFGGARVFMDLQDIAPGQNFARSIDDTIAACDCVVAVIGPRWVETFEQRAAAGEDFVQREIAAALRRDIAVVPVLVGGARMPLAEELPPALAALRYRNALEIRDERFEDDVARLSEAISALASGSAPGDRRPARRLTAAVAGLAVAVALGAAVLSMRSRNQTTAAIPEAATSALGGDWIAEVQKEGQPPFRVRLTFVTAGDSITGVVRYPTGDAPILDARLDGRILTFHTSHVPQFESTPAIIRYQSEVGAGEIAFTATDDFGIAKGVARRAPPSP
jgi:hypothetical protein